DSLVSTNETHPVRVHAFMWLTIRARRSVGVVSMKLTVSRRGVGPQYLAVMTAICRGSITPNPALPPTGAAIGALTGLMRMAVAAAFRVSRLGRALTVHPGTSTSGS